MCTRCVRFMREVAQDERLGIVQRGDRAVIDTFFDEGVGGSIWADNTIDICPVGALVSKDFLHKARAWDLDRTPSICPNCSMGCNIQLQVRDNEVMRLKPRPNDQVNGHWMCDYGRLNYSWINRVGRIEAPLVREGDRRVPMSWSDALLRLADAVRAAGSGAARVVVSPFLSNEDLGAARRLLGALGDGEGVYRSPKSERVELPGFPQLALQEDRAANVKGADLFGFLRVGDEQGRGGLEAAAAHTGTLVVMGDDLSDAPADFGSRAGLFVYVGHVLSPAARNAHFVLPVTTFAEMEGSFTNVDHRVQRFWPALQVPGMSRPAWQVLGVLLAGLQGSDVPATPADAFAGLGALRGEFAGLTYADLGSLGRPLARPGELAETAGD
jgi:NADH-quinone oxidoreductase subunit G